MITDQEIIDTLERKLPDFYPRGSLELLEGGNLNHVWRIQGEEENVIVKVAPPYIAATPEVPLSPERIQFEANALQLFEEGNPLHQIASDKIRPPRCLFFDQQRNLLVMEDIGKRPDIAKVIKTHLKSPDYGVMLGNFIGRLHKCTYHRNELASRFNNAAVQETRLNVQYKSAAEYARKGGIREIAFINSNVETLGQQLLAPGKCLVMGDLWPQSILVDTENLRLIDWEFCHYGRPLQDVGHLAAHCWMQAHTASSNRVTADFKHLWKSFWEEYQNVLGASLSELINNQEMDDIATHIGAEILIRATGPFKDGYVYQSYSTDHRVIQEATRKAKDLILKNNFSILWDLY